MTIRHGEVLLAAIFCAAAVLCIVMGLRFPYYDRLGPGPGFFPIWIGVLLAALSVGVVVEALIRHRAEAGEPFFPEPGTAIRVIGTLAFLALASWLMGLFGYRIVAFLFALIAPYIIAPLRWWLVLSVALLLSFGTAYVFETWLDVQLPHASIGVLRGTGL